LTIRHVKVQRTICKTSSLCALYLHRRKEHVHVVVCVVRQIIPRCEMREFGVSLIVVGWIGTRLLRIFTNPIWALSPHVTYSHRQQKNIEEILINILDTQKKLWNFYVFTVGTIWTAVFW